ncbi:tail fiber assembly protein [Pantoea agglomerans]|uniref:tail fiber assembly protein n=1 Tax=Enterobacter agglomerans TaxID=549 RepID=UPI0031455B46
MALYLNGSWQVIADHRGETVYSVNDGSAVLISAPGEYPADMTPIKPATAWDKWDGEKWVTDQAEEKAAAVKQAIKRQAELIAEANSITQAWQTQLRLEMITESDKASLMDWMKYVQAVQVVSTQNAPDITWPEKPE